MPRARPRSPEKVEQPLPDSYGFGDTYYEEWVAREGLELIKGYAVHDLRTIPLRPWSRIGASAVHIQLEGTGDFASTHIVEIPPSGELPPMRHIFEELVFVLSGRGATSVWYDDADRRTFEWQAGSFFAVPLNAWHQHFNAQGDAPARYVAATNAPLIMNIYRNDAFVFDNPTTFPERFSGQPDYYSGRIREQWFTGFGKPSKHLIANFIPDVNALTLYPQDRGVGVVGVGIDPGFGVMGAHITQFPAGVFSKLHRHGPAYHVIWLQGSGYSLMWPDGGDWVKESWNPFTMIVPPNYWWHQHAVVSAEPGRFLALKLQNHRRLVTKLSKGSLKSTRQGGNQIDYRDMDPAVLERVKRTFFEECERRGIKPDMANIDGLDF